MLLTDYKISRIEESDDGIRRVLVRFYEGDMNTAFELNSLTNELEEVTRYRRTFKLREEWFEFPPDYDIRVELNKELGKDKSRQPISKQRV